MNQTDLMDKAIKTINPKEIPHEDLHNYLLSSIGPRPIALVSTIDKSGNINLSPFSFYNIFSTNPPVVIFSPMRRTKDNSIKHSLQNVQEVGEVTINVVNYEIAEKMHLTSKQFEKGTNEFLKSGLTEVASNMVKPPRVYESPVSFECTVNQIVELGTEGGAGNLVICEIKMIHVDEAYLDVAGMIDMTKMNLVGRLGGNWYSKAMGDAIFEIPYDTVKTIGVDGLSQSIRNSNILDQNDLGRLGKLTQIPDQQLIDDIKYTDEVRELFLEFETERDMIKAGLHNMGKRLISQGKTLEALATLMIVDQI